MYKKLITTVMMASIVLTGCGFHLSSPKGMDNAQQASIFEMTPTAAGVKGEQNKAEPHSINTSSSLPAYPTPLQTYLVPSRLITITYAPTQIATQTTPTQITPTQTQPASTQTTNIPTQQGATATSTKVPPTATATTILPTATTSAQFTYGIQPGSPVFIPNFVNSSAACNWQGIAGQVFNLDGDPVKNLVVKAGGTWNNGTVNLLGMTGASTAYGEGGYEIVLGTKALNSTNSVWVQIVDLAGNALSAKTYVSTSSDCGKNLTLVNFKEIGNGINIYVPLVIQTSAP